MKNYTLNFINLIEKVISDNQNYFNELNNIKTKNFQKLKTTILNNLEIPHEKPYSDLNKIFQEYIEHFILERKNDFSMDTLILERISTQIELDYLAKKIEKTKAQLYHSITHAITYYGIYRGKKIVALQCTEFWEELIKKLYLLNLMNSNYYSTCCDDNYYNHPDFNKLSRLIDAKRNIEEKLSEEIEIIDSVVVFKKNQEERIVKKIEKKLSQLHLFNFLRYIFNIYEENKRKHNIELTIPYKYIINILIKNIANSKHKNNDPKKMADTINLLNSFISLYQLKEDKFKAMQITEHSLVEHLKSQVLYMNFYPIYHLKTNTLIEYIENLIKPNIKEELFVNKFDFSITDLIDFFKLLDLQKDDIVTFEKGDITNSELKILELFSMDSKEINKGYTTAKNLASNRNIFAMNPILKYKNKFYIIGFKYFKMNFYNSLTEKIKKSIDKEINVKIGNSVDTFVENIFTNIQAKNGYEIFSGNYKPPKKENPESDLALKLDKDIIFIENKNKYLTNHSFSGSDSNILKDLVLSFAFSQKQLLKHEKNLKIHEKITFLKDKRELKYENENIVKISISTSNWFNIMNNIPQVLLSSLIQLRFNIEKNITYENQDDFVKANKYLDELQKTINELYQNKNFEMRIVLNQTLFLPLELIVEKHKDNNFIECLKSLVGMKMNTDNILNIYDYCQYLNSYNKI